MPADARANKQVHRAVKAGSRKRLKLAGALKVGRNEGNMNPCVLCYVSHPATTSNIRLYYLPAQIYRKEEQKGEVLMDFLVATTLVEV